MGAKAQLASVLKKEARVLWEVQGGSGVPVQSRGIRGGPGLWKGAEVGRVVETNGIIHGRPDRTFTSKGTGRSLGLRSGWKLEGKLNFLFFHFLKHGHG